MEPLAKQSLTFGIAFAIGIIFSLFLFKSCEQSLPIPSHTVKSDTIWVRGESIYVEKIIRVPIPVKTYITPEVIKLKNYCDSVRAYSDTTRLDSNSYVVCLDTIVGIKKWSAIKYFSKPYYKQITTTITDSTPYAVNIPQRSLYASGGAGIGPVNHLYIGVDYFGKKRIGAGYMYDLLQSSHNVFLRIKLFCL